MKTINLDRYMPELSAMYSFYRYSEVAFQDPELRRRIIEQEDATLSAVALRFVTVEAEKSGEWRDLFRQKIHEKVATEIEGGLGVLRRQILEASHAIFEKYLCHVVRVYLHTFPQILMNIDKQISFRTVAELQTNDSILEHVVVKEVSHFNRRSLQEKKDYLARYLKQTHQDDVWTCDGVELWKDIDRKRQAIVHKEETPEISHDYLLRAINCLQGIMMGIAIFAQVDQGIKFTWATMSEQFMSKEEPTLR